jgi:hypothetical protein
MSLTTRSIIAGNHDLPLHAEWYEDSYYGFHDKKEVWLSYSTSGNRSFMRMCSHQP